ncbi:MULTISPECIES: ligase-associated DNA damage response endonuclease PdeM [Roseovarius]|jgi:DNA ligase-associated metallophosphoesterase|uniref:ligase-associated DNA damage response endonuclease PdeM n=1 Tax=Roseovarius TaxID=74030 RepID=UPI00273DAB9B|nr:MULTISPECIES: ligase-associated DNA damage response endonuclease PdeM [unclassified Roseovarius]
MNGYEFTLAGARLTALGSGALFWRDQNLLCVSDMHLGKTERRARLGEAQLPPYETHDTLSRLQADLEATGAHTVICLGDSFDDALAARALLDAEKLWISRLQAGRRWVWIEGNHDPGPVDLGGAHLFELPVPPLTFRHIAQQGFSGEVSGHYHPKVTLPVRGRAITRPAFLLDSDRLVMPAYGTYTGGLRSHDTALCDLMRPEALAILTGKTPHPAPMPRGAKA